MMASVPLLILLAVLGLIQGRWTSLYLILEPKPLGFLMAVGICSFSIGMAIGLPGSEAFYKTNHCYFHHSGHNASPLPSIQHLIWFCAAVPTSDDFSGDATAISSGASCNTFGYRDDYTNPEH